MSHWVDAIKNSLDFKGWGKDDEVKDEVNSAIDIFVDALNRKPEKEKPVEKRYPRTNLGVTRLRTNHMVFAYLPGGPQVFTGSIDRINSHLKDGPTCHGSLCTITTHPKFRVDFNCHMILGKYSSSGEQEFFVDMLYGNTHEPPSCFIMMGIRDVLTARKKFYLVKYPKHGDTEIVRSWRKLPKKYLRELAILDDPTIIEKEKRKKNRFNSLEFR